MRSNAQLYEFIVNSDCYRDTVDKIDKSKVTRARKGEDTNQPRSNIGRVAWELAIRAHLENPSNGDTPPPPVSSSWGWFDEPTAMCHAANGGVEYQEEQVKYFGSAMLDLNSPVSWDTYRARAQRAGLKTCYWRHVHTYAEIQAALDVFKPDGTGGLNLENIVDEGIDPARVAQMIDTTLGPDSILAIPTLGSIQQQDWSPLSRHVFLLEFFPNDPPPQWVGKTLDHLIRFCADTARACGVKKLSFVCGVYFTDTNPNAKLYTAGEYLSALSRQREEFGGIYLGDNNGPNYSQWRA